MGLIAKIIDRSPAAAVAAPPVLGESYDSSSLADPTATTPCQTCRGVAFWQDVYANPPHCRVCSPAPIASMVKRRLWLLPGEGRLGDDLPSEGSNPLTWFERIDGELIPLAEIEAGEKTAAVLGGVSGDIRSATIDRPDRNGEPNRTWTVLTATGNSRLDLLRLADNSGRYSPPRGFGPVGDMIFDEWWATLPDGLPGWSKAGAVEGGEVGNESQKPPTHLPNITRP